MMAEMLEKDRKQTCLYVYTHYAGAELLICDVQRVSVSVKPPTCPIFTCPLPPFKVRHLPGLKQTALLNLMTLIHSTSHTQ